MTEPKKKKSNDDEFTSEIPENFDRQWPGSDVILKVKDGRKKYAVKSIYANKSILAFYSPTYFRPMFFHEFNEKSKKEITIDVDYEIFLNILRVLHHIDYERDLQWLSPCKDVYKVAHELDFPFIRQRILQEAEAMTPAQAYFFKEALGIELNRANELAKMNGDNIVEFLETYEGDAPFSLAEAIAMVRSCGQTVLREEEELKCGVCYNCGDLVGKSNHEERCQSCVETCSTNFSAKWTDNALPARTTESDGRELDFYLDPEIMSIFSGNFKESMEEKLLKGELKLPYSFGVMNWILRTLLHKVRLDNYLEYFFPDEKSNPKLEEVAQAADEMKIPFLQRICRYKLEHPFSGERMIIMPLEKDIEKRKLRFSYNVIKDFYKWGDDRIERWKTGVYYERNMYRKQEWDHRKAYLSRQDDEHYSDEEQDLDSEIQWCVDLTGVRAKSLSIRGLACTTFYWGKYERFVRNNERIWKFPEERDEIVIENPSSTFYKLVVKLMGGKGDRVAWQYSQLFRSLMRDENDEQLVIEVDLV